MRTVRYAEQSDKAFWFSLDRHLPEDAFKRKIKGKEAYILQEDGIPAGLLRYNLFWDNTPFCTMLYIRPDVQHTGCGKQLLTHWENDMKARGYKTVLISTQADESAQHFYRKTGYRDCGVLLLDTQAAELFLIKTL